MNDDKFEHLIELAVSENTAESLPQHNHIFPSDFESKLRKKIIETRTYAVSEQPVIKRENRGVSRQLSEKCLPVYIAPRIFAIVGVAASLIFALSIGITMLHRGESHEMLQSTAVPMEEVQSCWQTASIVTTTATTRAEEQTTQMVTKTDVAAEDAPMLIDHALNEPEPPATDTIPVPQMTEITIQTTEITTPTLVYELGDVDMDGKITFVDALLVRIDMQLAERGMSAQSLITDEQRALGNVNGQSLGQYWDGVSYSPEWRADLNDLGQQIKYEPYLLDEKDYQIIERIVLCQYLKNEPITARDYYSTYENYSNQMLLDKMKNDNSGSYQKYLVANKIKIKYLNIENFDCFATENDNNRSCYSLEEFWADMEILREMYC